MTEAPRLGPDGKPEQTRPAFPGDRRHIGSVPDLESGELIGLDIPQSGVFSRRNLFKAAVVVAGGSAAAYVAKVFGLFGGGEATPTASPSTAPATAPATQPAVIPGKSPKPDQSKSPAPSPAPTGEPVKTGQPTTEPTTEPSAQPTPGETPEPSYSVEQIRQELSNFLDGTTPLSNNRFLLNPGDQNFAALNMVDENIVLSFPDQTNQYDIQGQMILTAKIKDESGIVHLVEFWGFESNVHQQPEDKRERFYIIANGGRFGTNDGGRLITGGGGSLFNHPVSNPESDMVVDIAKEEQILQENIGQVVAIPLIVYDPSVLTGRDQPSELFSRSDARAENLVNKDLLFFMQKTLGKSVSDVVLPPSLKPVVGRKGRVVLPTVFNAKLYPAIVQLWPYALSKQQ